MGQVKLELDFDKLWQFAIASIKDDRFRSALINHSDSKEKICRKLGIVNETDVIRIVNQLRIRPSRKRVNAVESRRRREPENGTKDHKRFA